MYHAEEKRGAAAAAAAALCAAVPIPLRASAISGCRVSVYRIRPAFAHDAAAHVRPSRPDGLHAHLILALSRNSPTRRLCVCIPFVAGASVFFFAQRYIEGETKEEERAKLNGFDRVLFRVID